MTPISSDLPDGVDLESLLDRLRHFSWGAADILIAYSRGKQPPYGFPKALEIHDGGDGPVSAADLAVNQWLLSGLNSSFPDACWNLISEENAKNINFRPESLKKEWVWILDPLDGTKDFLQMTGEYAVHLALLKNNNPLIGVVLVPEKEELWFGVSGQGAWCENRKQLRTSVSFSDRKDLNNLTLVASRNHRDKRIEQLITGLDLGRSKAVGSVGCKIASILRGDADVYISLSGKSAPKDWDMAAPHAVIKAAGGIFTHADGTALNYLNDNYEQRGCLIASHGSSHKKLCEKAESLMAEIDPDFAL